jgi:hypothetical protein
MTTFTNVNINALSEIDKGKLTEIRLVRFGLASVPSIEAQKEFLRVATEDYLKACEQCVGEAHALINVTMSVTLFRARSASLARNDGEEAS